MGCCESFHGAVEGGRRRNPLKGLDSAPSAQTERDSSLLLPQAVIEVMSNVNVVHVEDVN